MQFVHRFPIACASDQALSYLADLRNLPQWDPNALEAEKTSPGPVGIGTTFRIRVRLLGLPTTLDYRVVELNPGQRVVLRSENPTGTSVDVFEAVDDGRAVRYTADIRFGKARRLLEPLTRWYFAGWSRRAAARMGEVLCRAGADTPEQVPI